VAESGDVALLREHLKRHYRSLGPRSRRLRFLAAATDEALDGLAERAAPDLLLELVEEGAVRAVLEAHVTAPGHAELALSVEDRFQRRGLGRALFEEGLAVLAARGVRTADLYCLRENAALLGLARGAGARLRGDGGEVHVAIDLGRVPGEARAPGRGRPAERGGEPAGAADATAPSGDRADGARQTACAADSKPV
jgi:GNAT superfamily N-acetyltransferase